VIFIRLPLVNARGFVLCLSLMTKKSTTLANEAKARRTLFRTFLGVIAVEIILLIRIFGDDTWQGIDYVSVGLFYLVGFVGSIAIIILFIKYLRVKYQTIKR
jgi:hypothetical protein